MEMTKEHLGVQRAQRGDRAAFNQLVTQCEAVAFGLAYHLLGDSQLAEAAMQQSVLLAFQQLDQMQGEPFQCFLLSRLIQICQRLQPKSPEEVDNSPQHKQQGLRLLPFEQQVAVLLSDTYGFAQPDIARVMDISPERIAQAVVRGRATLRQRWFGPNPFLPHRQELRRTG